MASGRKNWIHTGSQQAGPKVAAIRPVVETCRRISIPVRHYLSAALTAELRARSLYNVLHRKELVNLHFFNWNPLFCPGASFWCQLESLE